MCSNRRLHLIVFALTLMLWNAPLAVATSAESEKHAILALVSRMETAWNRGDFKGYMAGFANPDVIFISRGEYQKDWQGTLDHYIRDYGASDATRGQLRFYDMKIEMLAPDAAQLNSRFHLERPENPLDGISTRILRKRGGQWVITLNHVSARELPGADGEKTAGSKRNP
jgi:ketosteroid isomerase-like protein